MQGYSHALTGAAGWLALSTAQAVEIGSGAVPISVNITNVEPGAILAGAIVCAGAALLPDADHHNGMIAHSLPPFSQGACRFIGDISGGHRHATHSLFGIAVFTFLAWLASFLTIQYDGRTIPIGAGIVMVPLVAFAIQGLHLKISRRVGPWVISLSTAGLAVFFLDYQWSWLPLAVGLGAFIHCLGDSLTTQGVPWLWPFNPAPPASLRKNPIVRRTWPSNGYFKVAVLGNTNSLREGVFGAFVVLYILLVLAQFLAG